MKKDVNSKLILELSEMIIKKCLDLKINVTLGGNLTNEVINLSRILI